jgi:hypothetical protein
LRKQLESFGREMLACCFSISYIFGINFLAVDVRAVFTSIFACSNKSLYLLKFLDPPILSLNCSLQNNPDFEAITAPLLQLIPNLVTFGIYHILFEI